MLLAYWLRQVWTNIVGRPPARGATLSSRRQLRLKNRADRLMPRLLEPLEGRYLPSGAPVALSLDRTTPAGSPTNATTLTYTLTFDQSVTGVDASDFRTVETGNATADNTVGVSGSGATYTVFVTGVSGNGTVGVNLLSDGTIQNVSSQPMASGLPGEVTTIDTISPHVVSLSRTTPSSSPTNATSITYTATFSESVTGVDASDFRVVTSTGVTANNTVGVSGSGATYTITVTGISGSGTVGVNLVDDNSIRDLAGNSLLTPGAAPTFAAAQNFGTGRGTNSVVQADVDGDGRPDLIVANLSDNTVSVLLGNGNGTFQSQQAFTATAAYSLSVSDVDGDGFPDLVVANLRGNTVSVLLGNGNGTFQHQQQFAAGRFVEYVSVADVNGDGRPDLIVANFDDKTVSVLLGNGDGTFQIQQTFGTRSNPESVTVGDVNGDGQPDVVTANADGTVSVLLGNGNGTFQNLQSFAAGSLPSSVSVADISDDGRPDLIVTNFSGATISVLLGNGNGTFQNQQTFATGSNPKAVRVRDLNGDGTSDLIFVNEGGSSAGVLLGNGNGTFAAAQSFPTGANPYSVSVGDLNGDGRLDLVAPNGGSNTVSVLLANGNGNFTGQTTTIDTISPNVVSLNRTTPASSPVNSTSLTYTVTFSESVTGLDASDFRVATTGGVTANNTVGVSGSGTTCTITVTGISGNGTVGVNLVDNNSIRDVAGNALVTPGAAPTFTAAQNFGTGSQPYSVQTADIDGDGQLDLIFANLSSDTLSVLLGNGNGTFAAPQNITTGDEPRSLVVQDVNGDGRLDLVVTNQLDNTVSVLLGNGNGTFAAPQNITTGISPVSVVVADLNGDGYADLAVANSSSYSVSVLLGNGNGTFAAPQNITAGHGPVSLAVGDMNGDGQPDLAIAEFYNNTVSVLRGNGDGTFAAPQNFATGARPLAVVIGDLDGDGKADLAVANSISGSVSVLLGNGDGTFAAGRLNGTGGFAFSLTIGDVNADGLPDLAVTNANTDTLTVLLGNGNGTFAPLPNITMGSFPRSVLLADLNHDGRTDLAVTNRDSNTVSVLLANGNGNFTGQTTTIETISPHVVSLNRTTPAASPTNSTGLTYTVIFSEGVTGVDASDFRVITSTGMTADNTVGVSGSGATYTITVTGVSGNGTVGVNLVDNNSIQDLAGNTLVTPSAVPSFAAAQNFAVGSRPVATAVGDLNRDGIPDLAVANFTGTTVSVLTGNGDGTFAAARNLTAGNSPDDVLMGDFNGDRNLDLAVANFQGSTVSIFLGNGDNTFAAAQNFATNVPKFIAESDVNGDGRLDLVASNYTAKTASVFLGNGDGTFIPATSIATGTQPRSVVLADLNGDSNPDLIVGNKGDNTGSVHLGNGNGTFGAPQNFSTGTSPTFMTVSDFNGDGAADLATANQNDNNVSVLPGNGDGTFGAARNYAVGTFPASVTAADVNGDGALDLVSTNKADSNVSVLQGNGNGTFLPPTTFSTGQYPLFASVADFNGDGRPDLAVVNNLLSYNVSVLLGSSNGNFTGQTTTIDTISPHVVSLNRTAPAADPANSASLTYTVTFSESVTGVDASDFNVATTGSATADNTVGVSGSGATYTITITGLGGDGTVGVNLVDNNSIRDAAGNTLFAPAAVASFSAAQNFSTGTNPSAMAQGDVNGDGHPDLVVANKNNNSISLLLGNADGTFAAPQNLASPAQTVSLALGDVNGDGKQDLLSGNYNSGGSLSIRLGNGDGTFAAAQSANASYPMSLALADLTGDGRADLASVSRSGGLFLLTGDGTGGFAYTRSLPTGLKPYSVHAADLNGDGAIDLAVVNYGSDTVSAFLGNGNGSFQAQQNFATGSHPRALAIADLNGDGAPDLLVANQGDNTAAVLLGNGNGTFQAQQTLNTGASPRFIVADDANGDGLTDLVVANTTDSTLSLLHGNGNGSFAAAQTVNTGSGPSTLISLDLNNDGRRDLAVLNGTEQTVSVLLSAGNGDFTGETTTIDNTPPALASINRANPNTQLTYENSVVYVATFSEPVTGVGASNFTLHGAAEPGARIGTPSTSDGGLTWSIRVSGLTADGSIHLDFTSGTGIQDLATNSLATVPTVSGEIYRRDVANRRLPQLIDDINLTAARGGALPRDFINVNGTLFFSAADNTHGSELWKSDGTNSGTVLVDDIFPGSSGAYPEYFTNVNGTLFFVADDGTHGYELWKSDGTSSGTMLVADIASGNGGAYPAFLTNVNGTLFFNDSDGTHGYELWKSDGASSGTVLVDDIYPGGPGANPRNLANVGGTLYFEADDGAHGFELWKSNGAGSGTVLVDDIDPGVQGSYPSRITNVNGALFFRANDGAHGYELWKSNGDSSGTLLVADINTGSNDSNPRNFTNVNGTLYFNADDGTHGYELWKSNGDSSGTLLVADINPNAGNALPTNLTNVNGTLYFNANDGSSGFELWKSDGTSSGTLLVDDIKPGGNGSDPIYLTNVNGTLFFNANEGANGYELWTSDGTSSGTVLVDDIYPGVRSSDPQYLTNVNGALFFTANDGTQGYQLWKSDGSSSGTNLVKAIVDNTRSSYAAYLSNVNGTVYFSANDGPNGYQLWKTDGTSSGTQLVALINPGAYGANPAHLTNVNGTLFFSADDGTNGYELWKSDGTSSGTVLVGDLYSGGGSSYPSHFGNFNGVLYFSANDGAHGYELWKSDGTSSGTMLVIDINSGGNSSDPAGFTNVNGTLFFSANDGTHGYELWKSDGTSSGTVLVNDIYPGSYTANPSDLTNVNGTLFFVANDGVHGFELWNSDGTSSGTVLVDDINSTGYDNSDPQSLTNVNGTLYFQADDGTHGDELWKSDGTSSGTVVVQAINSSGRHRHRRHHYGYGDGGESVNVNGTLYFSANDGTHGYELWKSDGTSSGTVLVEDINPGRYRSSTYSSYPSYLINVNGNLFFAADDGTRGAEPFVLDLNPPTAAVTTAAPAIGVATGGSNTTTITMTYADAISGVDANTFGSSNITVDHGATVTGYLVNGDAVTYTISSPAGDWAGSFQGTYTVSLAGTVKDLTGNPIAPNANLSTFLVDTVGPHVVSINRTTPVSSPTNATSLMYTVTFSESVTGVDPGDFQIVTTGGLVTSPTVIVSGSGSSYTLTVTSISGAGTAGINLVDDNSIHDAAGNPLVTPAAAPSFAAARNFATGVSPKWVAAGDLNGDGRPDLALANYGGTVSVLLGNGDGTFAAATNINVGSGSSFVALADINADGKLDLAVANSLSGTLSLLLGNGNGTFAAPQTIIGESYPISLVATDLNADGRLDLAVANFNSHTLHVFLGNGNGTFAAPQNFAVGSDPCSVAAADVDGDGQPDLVVCNELDGDVSVLLGNGNGTFAAAQIFTAGTRPRSVAVGDVNGDGLPDLVVANPFSSSVTVLLGNGNGTFALRQAFYAGNNPLFAAIADVNGDGHPDLAVANGAGYSVNILKGNGDGTFAPPQAFATTTSPVSIVVTDLNADGRPDVAVPLTTSNLAGVLLGIGNGDFTGQVTTIDQTSPHVVSINRTTPAGSPTNAASLTYTVTFSENVTGVDKTDFSTALSAGVSVANALNVAGSGATYTVTVSGISGNGTLGLNLVDNNSIRDLAGNPLATPAAPATFAAPQNFVAATNPQAVTVVDVTGDGKLDLVVANFGSDSLSLFRGNGNGTFTAPLNFAAGNGPVSLAAADVTGDGIPDLEVTNLYGASVSVFVGNGDGTFSAPQNFATQGTPSSLAVTDVNGDGRADLAIVNFTSYTVSVLLGNGNGTFAAAQNFATGAHPESVAAADVNGDGRVDLIVADAIVGMTNVLFGNGNGTFAAAQNFISGSDSVSVVAGDLNEDGKVDLAVANRGSGVVSVLLGNGNGSFQAPQNHTTGGPFSVKVADLNGDGHLDLVASNLYKNTLSVLLGNGNGTFGAARNMATGKDPRNVTVADLNGDGRLDMVVSNDTSNTLNVFLANANGNFTGQVTTLDQTAPTLSSINRSNPASQTTNASSVTFLVTFSEIVSGVSASNFALSGTATGGTIGTPTANSGGLTWTIVVTGLGSANGTRELDLANKTGIVDAASNALTVSTFNGQSYTLDHVAPSLSSINRSSPSSQTTNASTVTYLVTFSEIVSGVAASNFTLSGTATGGTIGTPTANSGGLTWTIVVTGLGSANGTRELDLANKTGIVDAASNALTVSTFNGQSYTLDHVAPSLSSINRSSPSSQTTNASTVTYLVTFSEIVSGVTASNFALKGTATGGTIGTPTTSDSGLTWSIVVTGLGSANGTRELDLVNKTGIVDVASNALSVTTFSGQSYTFDHVAPSLSSINRSSPGNQTTNASSVTFLVTFSEIVSGVSASNFALKGTATGGTIGTPTTSDSGLTWSIVVTGLGSANGTRELDLVNNTGIVDVASNALSVTTFSGQSYTFDHLAPSLSSINRSSPSSQTTNASSVTFLVTFSEIVSGVSASNFALKGTATGGTIGTPTPNSGGLTWTVVVTGLGSANGTRELDLVNNTGIVDVASNALAATTFSGQSYTLDHVAPTLTSITRSSPAAQLTNFSTVTYLATFSEKVAGVTSADFKLNGTAEPSSTLGAPISTDGGLTWTITVFTLTASGSVHLDLISTAGIKDLAGNALSTTPTVAGATYALDFIAPTPVSLASTSPITLITNAHSLTYLSTFSEKVTGLSTSNFTLTGAAEPSAVIGAPASSDGGLTWSITVSGLTASGFVRLELTTSNGIQDLAKNPMQSITAVRGNSFALDYVAPTLTSIARSSPTAQTTNVHTVTYLATFSEKVSGLVAANFKLNGTAQGAAVIGAPASSDGGLTWTITVSGLTTNGDIHLDLNTKTGIEDAATNALSATTPVTGATYTLAYPNPALVSLARSSPSAQLTNLHSVTYLATFSEKVSGVTKSNFGLTGTPQGSAVVGAPTTSDGGLTWTITVTGLTATGSVHLDLVSATGIKDVDSNPLLGVFPTAGAPYTLDYAAPQLTAIARSTPAGQLTNLHSVTYHVTFNEKVTGVAAANFKLDGTVQSAPVIGLPTTSDGGLTWSITVSGLSVSGVVQLDLATHTGIKDLAGNTLGNTSFAGATYTLDFSAPTLASIGRSSPTGQTTGSHSVTYLATFTEPVLGVTAANFKLNGTAQGTAAIGVPVSTDGGRNWSIAVTGLTASGTVHLDLASKTGIHDAAVNVLSTASLTGAPYKLDYTPPTLSSIGRSSPASQTTPLHSVTYLVTFSEKVTGLAASQFTLRGTTQPSAVIGSPTTSNGGLTWSITVTGLTAAGDIHLDLTGKTGIKDASGNALSTAIPFGGAIYTLDYSGATLNALTRKSPTAQNTLLHSVTYLATFSDKVSGVTTSNFKLIGAAQPSAVIGAPVTSDGGLTWSITVSGLTVSGSVQLELVNGTGIKDQNTNPLSSTLPVVGATYTLDFTLPELLSLNRSSPAAALTNFGSVTYVATFSEKVTGVVASDFTLHGTAESSATLGAPATSDGGLTWSIRVFGLTASGSIHLDLTSTAGIKDLDGNLLLTKAPVTGATYTLDYIDPNLTSLVGTAPELQPLNSHTLTYIATFTEKVTGVNAGNFTLTGTAQPALVIGAPTSSNGGLTWSIPVSGLTVSGFDRLDFTNRNGIHDLASNPIGSTSTVRGTSYVLDYAAPTLQSIGRSAPAALSTNLHNVTFVATFSEKVTGLTAANFKLNGTAQPGAVIGAPTTSDGGLTWQIPVSGLTASGNDHLDLTSSTGIKDVSTNALSTKAPLQGATFSLDYLLPTASVTKPAPAIAASAGATSTTTITVTYADTPAGINATTFGTSNVTVDHGAKVTDFSVSGKSVTYTITAPAATWNASFQGSYTIGLASTVKDIAGNAIAAKAGLATFRVDTVLPTAAVTTVPTSINTATGGTSTTRITVTYADATSGINTSTFGTSNITVDHGAKVTGFSVSGKSVTYTITAPAATWNTSFQGTYTIGLASTVKDIAGNAIAAKSNIATFRVDTVLPTAAVTTVPTSINTATGGTSTTRITVTYADATAGINTSTFGTSNITVDHGAKVTAFSVSGKSVTYTITAPAATWNASFQGTYTIGLASTVKDIAGNAIAAKSNIATFRVDTVRPTAAVTSVPTSINVATGGTSTTKITVTYADATAGINTNTFGTSNITVDHGAKVTAFSVSGKSVTYTITAPAATWNASFQGTYTIGLASTVKDLAGNAVSAKAGLATFRVDTAAPTASVTTAVPTLASTSAKLSTAKLVVTYADAVSGVDVSTFSTSNITVNHGAKVTAVSASGNVVTYTITAPAATWSASFQGVYTVSLAVNVKDHAGNTLAARSSLSTFIVDTAAPSAQVTTSPPGINAAAGSSSTTHITVTYADGSTGVNPQTFSTANLTVDHGAKVTGFSASGNVVTYTITAPAATWSASFQGTYTIGLTATIRNHAGNTIDADTRLASFRVDTALPTASVKSAPPAINASTGSASTTKITVTYADTGAGINTSTFSTSNITVDHGAKVTGVSASGNVVTYTITAPAATWSASFQGTYTIGLANTVKDFAGNSLAAKSGLATFRVDTAGPTESVTTAAPAIGNSAANGGATHITVTYADALSGVNPRTFGTSNITVDHGAKVTGFSASGNVVTYTITAPAPTWSASFQGTYTVALAGTVQDLAGNTIAAKTNLSTFQVATYVRMNRMHNPILDDYLYTTSVAEFQKDLTRGYQDQTTGHTGFAVEPTAVSGSEAVHRLYQPNGPLGGLHYLTASNGERDILLTEGWVSEPDQGFIYGTPAPGTTEIFHLYNTNSGAHLFTADPTERDSFLKVSGWVSQTSLGFAFAVPASSTPPTVPAPELSASSPAALPAAELAAAIPLIGSSTNGALSSSDVTNSAAPAVASTIASTASPSGAPTSTAGSTQPESTAAPAFAPSSAPLDDYWSALAAGLKTGDLDWAV